MNAVLPVTPRAGEADIGGVPVHAGVCHVSLVNPDRSRTRRTPVTVIALVAGAAIDGQQCRRPGVNVRDVGTAAGIEPAPAIATAVYDIALAAE